MPYRTQRRPPGAVGRTIRRMRKRLDLNQTELAALLGWPDYLICKYELGVITPGGPRLIRLLREARGEERVPILNALARRGVIPADLAAEPASGGCFGSECATGSVPTTAVSGSRQADAMSESQEVSDIGVAVTPPEAA